MRFDAFDFRLELRDPFRKLGQRIGRKVLTRQQCGGVSPRARAIFFIHHRMIASITACCQCKLWLRAR